MSKAGENGWVVTQAEFPWAAPAGATRLGWRDLTRAPANDDLGRLLRQFTPASPEPMLTVVSDVQEWRSYAPLAAKQPEGRMQRKQPALFRTFADIDPSPEGIQRFAQRFGFLGTGVQVEVEGGGRAEPLAHWQRNILWVRFLCQLWDLARTDDQVGLADSIVWQGKNAVHFQLPAELRVEGEPVLSASEHPETWARLQLKPGDRRRPALAYVVRLLDGMQRERCRPQLALVQGKVRYGMAPDGLLGAIYVQFALAVAEDRRYLRCPVCQRWFELKPGQTRADAKFCSASCQMIAYRRRMARACELHAEGKSAKDIAASLGSTTKVVQKWIKQSRKGG